MNSKTASVDSRVVDVVSEEKFRNNWSIYNNTPLTNSTAVEVEGENGEKYILPFRGKTDDRPGIYQDGCIYFVKEGPDYLTQNLDVVDFNDAQNVQEFIDKNAQIRQMETSILTDVDSVFAPQIMPSDSTEMKAFKQAICSKNIDINKYASRFGDNFLNDKRILKSNSITLNKLVSMCEKLDIELELRLRDAGSDVANPIGKEISAVLTKGEGGEDN